MTQTAYDSIKTAILVLNPSANVPSIDGMSADDITALLTDMSQYLKLLREQALVNKFS